MEGFYVLKLAREGEVVLDVDDDVEALRVMAAGWTRTQVAGLFHMTGPVEARAQRRLWPPPPIT